LHHSVRAERDVEGFFSPGGAGQEKRRGSLSMGAGAGAGGLGILGRKRSASSMVLDSPSLSSSGGFGWGNLGGAVGGGNAAAALERSTVSSSVGSVNMLASSSSSENSDDEDLSLLRSDYRDEFLEAEDASFTTPHVHKLQNPYADTPFAIGRGGGQAPLTPTANASLASNPWGSGLHFSPAAPNSVIKTLRRSRLQRQDKKTRKSSSSASGSGYSSMASPRAGSPPPLRSIESSSNAGSYFTRFPTAARSRRESLALGTDGLHLSSGNDSGDEASHPGTGPSTPGVVRRAVTRRGNLLPKTKGFARVRAALMEEAAPVDSEVRREAETIRQVRERDGSAVELDLMSSSQPTTGVGSEAEEGGMLPAVPEGCQDDLVSDLPETGLGDANVNGPKGLGMDFATHATRHATNNYWSRQQDPAYRTPPPPPLSGPRNFLRQSSSAASDINMDGLTFPSANAPGSGMNTPPLGPSAASTTFWRPRPRARSRSSASDHFSDLYLTTSTSGGSQPTASINNTVPSTVPTAAANGTANGALINDDIHLNRFKRRREDDFDIGTLKRRAVSPGMSANNSPVLTQSPVLKATEVWGAPPEKIGLKEKDVVPSSSGGSRHGSGGSVSSLAGVSGVGAGGGGGKRVGLQGMVDTNDGIMKMSIE